MIETTEKNLLIACNGLAQGYVKVDLERSEIDMISVTPRRKGYGSILLMKAEDEMRARGFSHLRLRPIQNEKVIGFYKKNGYSMTWFDWMFTNVWTKKL